MPRFTQKQIAFAERKERAKELLRRALRLPADKNPEMQNVQKLISLLSQPEFGVEYNEQDAIDLVLQKRNERKRMTKKGVKKINLPVRNGSYQTRFRERAQAATIGTAPPPRNKNLDAEFRSYLGVPKTPKSKKDYVPVIPDYLEGMTTDERMNIHKFQSEKALEEHYGKEPPKAMVTLMAKLLNQGLNTEQIYAILEKRNKSKGKTLKKNNRPVLPPPFETVTYTGPTPSAPSMITQQPYLPIKTAQTLRRSSRFTQKKMTACELCEFEKQGRLSAADKEAIANIGQQIQQRRNGVVANPFA